MVACGPCRQRRKMAGTEALNGDSTAPRAGPPDMSHDSPELASAGSTPRPSSRPSVEAKPPSMQPAHRASATGEVLASLTPGGGGHFLDVFRRVDRARLGELSPAQRQQGLEELRRALGAKPPGAPEQLQC